MALIGTRFLSGPNDAVSQFGESPSGKAPDFDSGIRRFDPYLPSQLSEQPPVAAVFVVMF